jgi:uncharacterized glyoxalase superfamily metalloenzyme YdcJ
MPNARPSAADLLRQKFSRQMSVMYCQEVPDYQKAVDLVKQVNADVAADTAQNLDLEALSEERHGAIRLGKASELSMMRRLFAVLGMYPVGYYDLSVAGIPVHSTAFRPISNDAIAFCPFRIFTSLLRVELIEDADLRDKTNTILAERNVFSDKLVELLEKQEATGSLTEQEEDQFIEELVKTFKWNDQANVSADVYEDLHDAHRLIADVVSFKGPHINHLTPRTLDIDAVQDNMAKVGLNPKAVVEGPPQRAVPILLRQTAFKALEEEVFFQTTDGKLQAGAHTARFGEIEQRGAALTPKGQALYDELLNKTRAIITPKADGSNVDAYIAELHKVFQDFPDDLNELRAQGLIYCHYQHANGNTAPVDKSDAAALESLIQQGAITFSPITYEDFLPVSAAGIFQSNLGNSQNQQSLNDANQADFEKALGAPVNDLHALYATMQDQSLQSL